MEGSVLSFLKAEWKVSDTGSAHWASSLFVVSLLTGGRQVTDKLYHIVLHRVYLVWAGFKLATLLVTDTEFTDSCKSNYQTIPTMTVWEQIEYVFVTMFHQYDCMFCFIFFLRLITPTIQRTLAMTFVLWDITVQMVLLIQHLVPLVHSPLIYKYL